MKIYRSINKIPFVQKTIITLGTFDGIHLGHLELLRRLNYTSRQMKARGLVITFEPHPLKVVHLKGNPIKLLTTTKEKLDLFKSNEIEHVLLMPFTEQLAKQDASDFIKENLIKRIGLTGLIIGYNHTIGRDRKGNPNLLKILGQQLNFFVEQIPSVKVDNHNVSSTGIRNAIKHGNIGLANRLLGRFYAIEGLVTGGKKVGRQLGFPTANIQVNRDKLIPKDGVYAVLVHYEKKCFKGVANIGFSPSIPGKTWGIEIFIDNFSQIIYNSKLKIEMIARLRDEKHFKTTDILINQIEEDKKKAHEILMPFIRR